MTIASPQDLLATSPHLCPTPIDADFYEAASVGLRDVPVLSSAELGDLNGLSVDVTAGSALRLTLVDGPQIVDVWAYNQGDPDERIWHESVIREGIFLRRHTRVWGTMARYRPLMTVLEDTVVADPGVPAGQHHPYFGGSGTPSDWELAGGAPGVASTWEQFAELLRAQGLRPELLNEHLCLFQRSLIDADRQRIEILPSNAVAGDRVSLFAEIDLTVLIALSPYVDGSTPASELGIPSPRRVEVSVTDRISEPLPWPYPGLSYPDLSLYLDASGSRDREPVPTRGINYEL